MKKTISLALALLLCAAALPLLAAETVSLPELGVYLSPEPGQTLVIPEQDPDDTEESPPYAVLTDGEGNRMDLWRLENPDWAELDLTTLRAAEQADIADSLIYGPGYIRLGEDGVPEPDVTLLTLGEFPFLGISYPDVEERQMVCLFAVLPKGQLYCTFVQEDGGPVDADDANALMTSLYSLSATEEGSVPYTEDKSGA